MMLKSFLIVGVAFLVIDMECKSIQNDSVNSDVAELKQSVMDLSVKLQNLNGTLQRKDNHVMFYAIIANKFLTRNVDSTLVFETVIINEGGHYDKYDGVFVAPVKGIYLFSWTVTGDGGDWIVTNLVIEEKIISTAGELNSGGGYPSGSMTALCKMDKGDHAWIKTTSVSTGHEIRSQDNYPQTSFLGILIRQD